VGDLRIEREVLIDAPVEVVWRTVTEPEQIRLWFADEVELDVRTGGHGVLVFNDRPHRAPLVVEEVDAPRRFSFRWGHDVGEVPAPGNSLLVEFILVPEGDAQTRLRVVESELELLGWADSQKEGYAEDHRAGWGRGLDRLAGLFAPAAN